jgi:hypothetical protein
MNDCCCNGVHQQKQTCPLCGHEDSEVTARTITHHIKDAWTWQASAQRYFLCDDPACEVVYFGDDGSTILKSEMRTCVGVKALSDDTPLCYCFGVSKADFRANPATRDFVLAQTKAGLCSCETSNPSGRCCLKDFPI